MGFEPSPVYYRVGSIFYLTEHFVTEIVGLHLERVLIEKKTQLDLAGRSIFC